MNRLDLAQAGLPIKSHPKKPTPKNPPKNPNKNGFFGFF
jgi:hypothetical protein